MHPGLSFMEVYSWWGAEDYNKEGGVKKYKNMWGNTGKNKIGSAAVKEKSEEQMGLDGKKNNGEFSFLPCDGIYSFCGGKNKNIESLSLSSRRKAEESVSVALELRHLSTTWSVTAHYSLDNLETAVGGIDRGEGHRREKQVKNIVNKFLRCLTVSFTISCYFFFQVFIQKPLSVGINITGGLNTLKVL